MIYYGVTWHPGTDNLGDDLRTLAALQLMPQKARWVDVRAMEQPAADLAEEDRLVLLCTGPVFRHLHHWPPHPQVSPVMVGVHASERDTWGIPFTALDGAGKEALKNSAPVGCRDESTFRQMQQMGVPCEMTGCITLTLSRPEVPTALQPYVCCVDVPQGVTDALRAYSAGAEVREMTHTLTEPSPDFDKRMAEAQNVLKTYAAATMVITRRLHCAMACLAVGTPVMLLYNSGYEDVNRFAPLHQLVRTQSVDDFLAQMAREGFPVAWKNDARAAEMGQALRRFTAAALKRAETARTVSLRAGQIWRRNRLQQMVISSRTRIQRLEQQRYEILHEKFTILMQADAAKAALLPLMNTPDMKKALRRMDWKEILQKGPWYRRLKVFNQLRKGEIVPPDTRLRLIGLLEEMGWPETPADQMEEAEEITGGQGAQ